MVEHENHADGGDRGDDGEDAQPRFSLGLKVWIIVCTVVSLACLGFLIWLTIGLIYWILVM